MAYYEYRIGAEGGATTNLEDIISSPPSGCRFNQHSVVRVGGDGVAVGDGYQNFAWFFNYLSWADFDTLLDYIGTNASGMVRVKTRVPDGAGLNYLLGDCVMHRPRVPEEAKQHSGGWLDVSFRFTGLTGEIIVP